MTPADLIAAIVAAVEGCSVDSVSPRDVLRHQPAASEESATDERMFVLLPLSLPERASKMSGTCSTRRVELQLAIAYTWTPQAAARVIADGRLIVDALEGLPASTAGLSRIEILSTSVEHVDAVLVAGITLAAEANLE